MNVSGLVQLCQNLPVGYSLCLGLPTPPGGRISDSDELFARAAGMLENFIAPTDGIAIGLAFRAARTGNFDAIPTVCQAMSSDRVPGGLQLASLQMGQRLWELSRRWEWARGVHEEIDPLAAQAPLHQAVAFGILVSETMASQVRAVAVYLVSTMNAIVTAAITNIPRGQDAGRPVIEALQPRIARLAHACIDRSAADIHARPDAGSSNL